LNFDGTWCIKDTHGGNWRNRRIHIGNRGLKGTVRKDENITNSVVEDIGGAFYTDHGTFNRRRCVEHAGTAVAYNSQRNTAHRGNIEGENDVNVCRGWNFLASKL